MTMLTVSPGDEPTTRPQKPWLGYAASLVGSLAGGYWLGGWMVTSLIMSSPGSLAVFIVGPILLVPVASALGVLIALGIARQHSALFTALFTLPVMVVIWLLLFGLTTLGNTGSGWFGFVPLLVGPLGGALHRPRSQKSSSSRPEHDFAPGSTPDRGRSDPGRSRPPECRDRVESGRFGRL